MSLAPKHLGLGGEELDGCGVREVCSFCGAPRTDTLCAGEEYDNDRIFVKQPTQFKLVELFAFGPIEKILI